MLADSLCKKIYAIRANSAQTAVSLHWLEAWIQKGNPFFVTESLYSRHSTACHERFLNSTPKSVALGVRFERRGVEPV